MTNHIWVLRNRKGDIVACHASNRFDCLDKLPWLMKTRTALSKEIFADKMLICTRYEANGYVLALEPHPTPETHRG